MNYKREETDKIKNRKSEMGEKQREIVIERREREREEERERVRSVCRDAGGGGMWFPWQPEEG